MRNQRKEPDAAAHEKYDNKMGINLKSGYLYKFDIYIGIKCKIKFSLGRSVACYFVKILKKFNSFVFVHNYFNSHKWILKLSKQKRNQRQRDSKS